MFARLATGLVLFLGSLAAGLTPTPSNLHATITPGPRIELLRKQNNDRYMGWVSAFGTWGSEECNPGYTYNEDSEFWGCCSTTTDACAATDRYLGCISGESIIWSITESGSASRTTAACSSIFTAASDRSFSICNTALMYENDRDTDPLTRVACGVSTVLWSYYRVQPSDAVVSPTTSSTLTPTPIPTSPTPIPAPPQESKAWIAGVVIGPIVGIGLIGFLAWFFIRRKKIAQPQPDGGGLPTVSASYPQQPYSPGPPQYHPPPMQQYQEISGVGPLGVSKHDGNVALQSPIIQGSQYPNSHNSYGQAANSSMSPQQGHVQPELYGGDVGKDNGMFQHTSETDRRLMSELDGTNLDGQPEQVRVLPNK